MSFSRQIRIPTLVRIKPGALERMGIYATRHGLTRVAVVSCAGLPAAITELFERSLADGG